VWLAAIELPRAACRLNSAGMDPSYEPLPGSSEPRPEQPSKEPGFFRAVWEAGVTKILFLGFVYCFGASPALSARRRQHSPVHPSSMAELTALSAPAGAARQG
jgi:hypothetical protein